MDQFGGTHLSDQFNFVVRYTGTIDHPGGSFVVREDDDRVEDVVWVFMEDKVGSALVGGPDAGSAQLGQLRCHRQSRRGAAGPDGGLDPDRDHGGSMRDALRGEAAARGSEHR